MTLALAGDVLVVLGTIVVTIAVYGLFRMPDVYTKLHATSTAVFLGIIALLVASVVTRDTATIARAGLIAVFLLLTAPVATHVVARAAYRIGERMETPGASDESGRDLPEGEPPGEEQPTARMVPERASRAPTLPRPRSRTSVLPPVEPP